MIPVSILRRIPGCAGGEAPLNVQPLHGGRSVNLNLRIDTRLGRFVLRQRIWEGPRPGADPLREVACHRAAAAAGVAPAVLDADEVIGCEASEVRIRHSAVRILSAQPAIMVSRQEFPALGEVSTFPAVGGQRPGFCRGMSGTSYGRRRFSGPVSAR